jgi:hypothetical protein
MLLGGGPADFGWGANNVNPMAQPQASGSKHTANLGPTGLRGPGVDPAMAGYSSEDDVPGWGRRPQGFGMGEFEGGELGGIATEADVHSFFETAAEGYDFSEEGEAALDEALTTLGMEKRGDTLPKYVHPFSGLPSVLIRTCPAVPQLYHSHIR